ncbi:hypothetical protein VTI28DRAFT_280 [Corynascus sepedonium]
MEGWKMGSWAISLRSGSWIEGHLPVPLPRPTYRADWCEWPEMWAMAQGSPSGTRQRHYCQEKHSHSLWLVIGPADQTPGPRDGWLLSQKLANSSTLPYPHFNVRPTNEELHPCEPTSCTPVTYGGFNCSQPHSLIDTKVELCTAYVGESGNYLRNLIRSIVSEGSTNI